MTEHGTTSKYTHGCRCERCRAANAEYQRAYQAKRKGSDDAAEIQAAINAVPTSGGTVVLAPRAQRPTPLDELVAACQDLRAAFAAYHAALEEPVA